MNRKPPIRTYQRTNLHNTNTFYKPSCLASSNRNNLLLFNEEPETVAKNDSDNSLNYDPFDTTFDRLARNAKLPPKSQSNNETSYLSSSYLSSEADETKENPDIDLPVFDNDYQPKISKRRQRKDSSVRVLKRKLSKQTVVKSKRRKARNNKDSFSSNNIEKVTKKGNKKAIVAIISPQPKLQTSIPRSDSFYLEEDYWHSSLNIQDKNTTEQYVSVHKNEDIVQHMELSVLLKTLNIKPCSVVLDSRAIEGSSNNVDYTKNIKESKSDKESTALSLKKEQHSQLKAIETCYVKLERLKPCYDISTKIHKVSQSIISSTPLRRNSRKLAQSLRLSPIAIKYTEELNDDAKQNYNNNSLEVISTNSVSVVVIDTTTNPYSCVGNENSANGTDKENIQCNSITMPTSVQENYLSVNVDTCEDIDIHEEMTQVLKSSFIETSVKGRNATDTEISIEDGFDQLPTQKCANVENDTSKTVSSLGYDVSVSDNMELSNMKTTTLSDSDMFSVTKANESLLPMHERTQSSSTNMETSLKRSEFNSDSNVSNDINISSFHGDKSVNTKNKENSSSEAMNCTENISENNISENNISENNISESSLLQLQAGDRERSSTNIQQNYSLEKNDDKEISVKDLSVTNQIERSFLTQPRVLLMRLQDPVRITNRRRRYQKWTFGMEKISESSDTMKNSTEMQSSLKEQSQIARNVSQNLTAEDQQVYTDEGDKFNFSSRTSFYLKPGKSWARSLSILNNMQNGLDLGNIPASRGRNWSHSVRDILDMQKQGIATSCIKENDDNNHLRYRARSTRSFKLKLPDNRYSTLESTTRLDRISRRISVRVVPTNTTLKNIDDASFLEAYGILTNDTQTSTNCRQTLVSNIQPNDSTHQLLENDLHSKAKEVVLRRCEQNEYLPFSKYLSDLYLDHCKKIGEGVYGEVFLHEYEDVKSVIKIIPIEGSELVNGEPQKKFNEILSEIVIAKELHDLRHGNVYCTDGFVEVKDIKCVMGKYPLKLLEQWKIYDENKRSDNDCPDIFQDDQLYIALELGHGGQDLEAFVFNTADEAFVTFQQIALTLAVAEEAVQFEHRDLHWGNVLISRTEKDCMHYKLGNREFNLPTKGVKVSIIDFTLSRVLYEGCCIFNDLGVDPALFTAQGDYQFEIYRLMRDKLENDWQRFDPYTNVLWLHYILDKMITAARYKKKTLKAHKAAIKRLKQIKDNILHYESSCDFVSNSNIFANVQRTIMQ